jgi:multidrug efflux pump subunit AcrA (membrane-fusion protein)
MQRILRYIVPVLFFAAFAFIGYKFVYPLFKPEPEETDIQTAQVRRGDLRQSVPSDGTVTPAVLVEVKSKASGVVQKIHVEAGDIVVKGDILVELDRKEIEADLRDARAGLESANAQLALAKEDLTPQQRASLESGVRQAEIGVEEAGIALADAQASYDRIAEMHARGYATQSELDALQLTVNNARQRVQSSEEQLAAAREQLELELEGGQPEQVAMARANVTRAQAAVDNVLEELANTTIRAPQSGTVLTRPVEIGTAVASGTSGATGGTTVATIGDLSSLYVKARIEETDLGRVATGLPVRITFDAYAGWLWNGTVQKIYPQGEDPSASGGQGGGGQGTRFPVDIAIDLASARQDHDAATEGGPPSMASGGGGGGRRRPGGGGGGRGRRGGGGGGGSAPAASAPAPTAEPAEAPAEAELPKSPSLFPQMTASVEIVLEDHPDVVIVPAQFVKFEDSKAVVEVAASEEAPEVREKRTVELGFSDGLRYEVKSGIEAGETVVLERVIKDENRR